MKVMNRFEYAPRVELPPERTYGSKEREAMIEAHARRIAEIGESGFRKSGIQKTKSLNLRPRRSFRRHTNNMPVVSSLGEWFENPTAAGQAMGIIAGAIVKNMRYLTAKCVGRNWWFVCEAPPEIIALMQSRKTEGKN